MFGTNSTIGRSALYCSGKSIKVPLLLAVATINAVPFVVDVVLSMIETTSGLAVDVLYVKLFEDNINLFA